METEHEQRRTHFFGTSTARPEPSMHISLTRSERFLMRMKSREGPVANNTLAHENDTYTYSSDSDGDEDGDIVSELGGSTRGKERVNEKHFAAMALREKKDGAFTRITTNAQVRPESLLLSY